MQDGSLDKYRLYQIDISKLTQTAAEGLGLSTKEVARCKNFWALGLMFWMYNRPTEREIDSIQKKFAKLPQIAEANVRAFKAGYYYGETAEIFDASYVVRAAQLAATQIAAMT